jgi:hypothetical protein
VIRVTVRVVLRLVLGGAAVSLNTVDPFDGQRRNGRVTIRNKTCTTDGTTWRESRRNLTVQNSTRTQQRQKKEGKNQKQLQWRLMHSRDEHTTTTAHARRRNGHCNERRKRTSNRIKFFN